MKKSIQNDGLPHSTEIERALLGSVILDASLLRAVASQIGPDDFYSANNRMIYQACVAEGESTDLVTVAERLKRDGTLERIGGSCYLASLMDGIPIGTAFGTRRYIEILLELSAKRQAARFGDSFRESATNGGTIGELDSELRSELKSLATFAQGGEMIAASMPAEKVMLDLAESWASDKPYASGISSGIDMLDSMTGGFAAGDLVIVAARPSMGKSALCIQILLEAALRGDPVGLVSLEMSRELVVLRMLANLSGVSLHRMRSGFLSKDDKEKVTAAYDRLRSLPIYIDDSPAIPVQKLGNTIRGQSRRARLRLGCVDYLQLVRADAENRTQEVSRVSAALQAAARELGQETGGALIAVSQLSRESGAGHPELHHLRDSGAIEQDADTVVFISREKDDDEGMLMRITIAKQRNGPTGRFNLVFLREPMRFVPLSSED